MKAHEVERILGVRRDEVLPLPEASPPLPEVETPPGVHGHVTAETAPPSDGL